jgi:hypothetical protein
MTAQERALGSEKDRFAVNEAFFGGGLSLAQVGEQFPRGRGSQEDRTLFHSSSLCFVFPPNVV